MIKSINLSTRLLTVAKYIQKGAKFADIGSDHAYLPCYICLKDYTAKAIAGEVNEGPYNSAKENVIHYNLSDVIDVRLGDGLEVIKAEDEIDHVIIAGMGGSLIKSILDNGKKMLENVHRIIAQPNVDARNVRQWLTTHHFIINHEAVIEESGHIYEVIVADKEPSKISNPKELDDKELLFGPILLKNKTKSFYAKWTHEQEKLQRIIEQMKQAKEVDVEKIVQFEKELKWIEEVLKDD
ncbi:tRNA (adenine(22)-N(1))-methyltransferase [Oceanobacillus senegalensis]|uniref:tRNA (adenine(22)-N(1))-methyltransferase n=1 Tax=Oceanobacillus senegalensis TaxID=1936063 RepID=UPI000A30698F|nr:tRNA (adenine(22)-N(1))-methyltransferase TrmK [Oceanobacillus senegalensis]